MAKSVEFSAYNGWSNYPTWAAFTHITDNDRLRLRYRDLAGQGKVQEDLTLKAHGFAHTTYQDEFREMLIQDWMTCAIQWVDWLTVLSMLRGKELEKEPTNLDEAAVAYFETIPGIWQTIVSDAEGGEDAELKQWALDGVITWIQSPEAREYAKSPLSIFARSCLEIVISSVDWKRLTEALQEA